MSKAIVIDVKAISRAAVALGRRQVTRARKLFEMTQPFLEGSWPGPVEWAGLTAKATPFAYPTLLDSSGKSDRGVPAPMPVNIPSEEAVPKSDQPMDDLLAFLAQAGLNTDETKELPSGAIRITFKEPELVRVR